MDDGCSPTIGILILVILLALDVLVFGFVAAMQNLNEASIEKLSKEGDKKALRLMRYIDKSSRYTHICQLIMLAVHMVLGFLLVPSFKMFFFKTEDVIWISVIQSILIVVVLMAIVLTFGIYAPEKIAARKAEKWALGCVSIFGALEKVFFPSVFLLDKLSDFVARIFGVDMSKDVDDVTEEEIISMVNEGHEQGVLLASEAEMIHNIFEFGDKEAKDIMTHRKNIIAVDGNMTFIDVIQFLKENNYSRFPVYVDDIDNIIGVLHIKEALTLSQEHQLFNRPIKDIDELVREVEFIPETRNINTLFTRMQSKKSHMVIVVDEYGQTAGIVAMEDILEEIVGNIEDEHDEEERMIERRFDGSFLMSGMTPVEEVLETLDVEFEDEDEFETLNGLLTSLIDRILTEDDLASTEAFGYRFEVLEVENKMIKTVKVTKLPKKNDGEETESCRKDEIAVE